MLVDSHCHLNDEAFDDDLDEVITKMVSNEVLKAMIVSLNEKDYLKAKKIKSDKVSFNYSVGVYPGDVDDFDEESFLRIVELMKDDECKAVGEIGLDYYWRKDNKERQKEFFERQIKIALELDKPVIIHARDAMQDTFDIIKKYRPKGVMHCYSGSAEMAKEFVKLGFYISIAGPITYKNVKELLEVIKVVPLNRLLIETDSPYLPPVPFRGKRNDPSLVIYTAKKIMEELGIDDETFKRQIVENYDNLFQI